MVDVERAPGSRHAKGLMIDCVCLSVQQCIRAASQRRQEPNHSSAENGITLVNESAIL